MRTTKALLCAAAIAAGAVSAMAQSNVYSLNVVGYINLPLVDGFNMVANQLDSDGTGTNNTIVSVFTNALPAGTTVYTWNGSGYNIATYAKNKTGTLTNWTANFPFNPGQGAWVQIPTGTFGSSTGNVTTVGQVLQGSLVNPFIPQAGGFSIVSSMVPVSGGLQSGLKYGANAGETVYQWNGVNYTISTYAKNKTGTLTNWTPSEPTIKVGEGFWLQSVAGTKWSNNFTIQ